MKLEMGRVKYSVIIVMIMLLLNACGKNLEDPDPPARPEWAVKSSPYDTTESGIDANPSGDVIGLEWITGSEDDIDIYRLYRASGSIKEKFSLLEEVPSNLTAGAISTYIDDNVSIGSPYYYFLRAVDQSGNLSPRSDTIGYKLVQKVNLIEPATSNITTVKPTFKWSDPSTSVSEYVIRVEQFIPNRVIWLSAISRQNYSSDPQSLIYGGGTVFYLAQVELSRGVNYRWRIDTVSALDRENEAGSESNWGYFTIQ